MKPLFQNHQKIEAHDSKTTVRIDNKNTAFVITASSYNLYRKLVVASISTSELRQHFGLAESTLPFTCRKYTQTDVPLSAPYFVGH